MVYPKVILLGMCLHKLQIQQVSLFLNSGACVFNLDWGTGLSADLFSNLISAINSFSMEALGLELCEISTNNQRVFLSRTNGIIIAVMVNESKTEYPELRSKMFSLMGCIQKVLESINAFMFNTRNLTINEVPVWLQQNIELELVRIFPASWLHFAPNTKYRLDINGIRLLSTLSDQTMYSRYALGKILHLTRSQVEHTLSTLLLKGFIKIETINERSRSIDKYTISELGKFSLDSLETFPGLWFQQPKIREDSS